MFQQTIDDRHQYAFRYIFYYTYSVCLLPRWMTKTSLEKLCFNWQFYPKSNLSPRTINSFRMYKCKSVSEKRSMFLGRYRCTNKKRKLFKKNNNHIFLCRLHSSARTSHFCWFRININLGNKILFKQELRSMNKKSNVNIKIQWKCVRQVIVRKTKRHMRHFALL